MTHAANTGIQALANELARHGRYGDTMLAHINPEEAALLKAMGGSGTRNPVTGLPEFFNLRSFLGSVLPIAAMFIPGIGPVASSLIAAGIGGLTGPNGGFDLKRAAMSGLMNYGVGQLAQGAMNAGQMASAAQAPNAALAGADAAITNGATAAGTAAAAQGAPTFAGNVSNAASGVGAAMSGDAAAQATIKNAVTPTTVGMTMMGMSGVKAADAAQQQQLDAATLQRQRDEEQEKIRQYLRDRPFDYSPIASVTPRKFADGGAVSDANDAENSFRPQVNNSNDVSEISNPFRPTVTQQTPAQAAASNWSASGVNGDRTFKAGMMNYKPITADDVAQQFGIAPLTRARAQLPQHIIDLFNGSKEPSRFSMADTGSTAGVVDKPTPGTPPRASTTFDNVVLKYAGGPVGFAGGGFTSGPGDGMSDSIPATINGKRPARLGDGEFVLPADVVAHLGNGSSKAGAQQLYAMMDRIRMARTGTPEQAPRINPRRMMPH